MISARDWKKWISQQTWEKTNIGPVHFLRKLRKIAAIEHPAGSSRPRSSRTAERPTQLNSTQLAVGLSWVEWSCKSVQSASGALNTLTTPHNSTENFQNWKNSLTSWVELSRVVRVTSDSELPTRLELSWVGRSEQVLTVPQSRCCDVRCDSVIISSSH